MPAAQSGHAPGDGPHRYRLDSGRSHSHTSKTLPFTERGDRARACGGRAQRRHGIAKVVSLDSSIAPTKRLLAWMGLLWMAQAVPSSNETPSERPSAGEENCAVRNPMHNTLEQVPMKGLTWRDPSIVRRGTAFGRSMGAIDWSLSLFHAARSAASMCPSHTPGPGTATNFGSGVTVRS